jgi:hypothetical protein
MTFQGIQRKYEILTQKEVQKLDKLFLRLDQVRFLDHLFFQEFVPIWQYFIYGCMIAYYSLTLLFQPVNFQYTTGLFNSCLVLFNEIIHPNNAIMNPLLNRGLDNGGHILAYLSLVSCALWFRFKLPKNSKGFYYSLLIPAFVLSVTEGMFDAFYWSFNYYLWPHLSWFLPIVTNPFLILYISLIVLSTAVTPIWRYFSGFRIKLVLILMLAFFSVWTVLGLPVTLSSVDYIRGLTPSLETLWYSNVWVNGLECLQWILASFCFALAIR